MRKHTSLPLYVGFGIDTPEQARSIIEAGADGVIIGSRLVNEFPDLQKISVVCKLFKHQMLSHIPSAH